MSTRKKRKEVIKKQSSVALLVDDPTTTAKNCANYIKKVLNTSWLSFTEDKALEGGKLFSLKNSNVSSKAYDKNRDLNYSVIPLDSSDIGGNLYWLTVSMIFASILAQYKLEEVRIMVFRGAMSDLEKEAFFRAEWRIPENNSNRDAQPHWHVYRTLQDKELFQPLPTAEEPKDFGTEVAPPALATEAPEEKKAPFEKFHFAMASSWHIDDEHQRRFDTEQSLFDWLSRCIKYIHGQLNYIAAKEGIA